MLLSSNPNALAGALTLADEGLDDSVSDAGSRGGYRALVRGGGA